MEIFAQPTGVSPADLKQQGDQLFSRRLLYRTDAPQLEELCHRGFREVASANFLGGTHFLKMTALNWKDLNPDGALLFQYMMRIVAYYTGNAPSTMVVKKLSVVTASYDGNGNCRLVMEPLLNEPVPLVAGQPAIPPIVVGYRLRVFARVAIPRGYVEGIETLAHPEIGKEYNARNRKWLQLRNQEMKKRAQMKAREKAQAQPEEEDDEHMQVEAPEEEEDTPSQPEEEVLPIPPTPTSPSPGCHPSGLPRG